MSEWVLILVFGLTVNGVQITAERWPDKPTCEAVAAAKMETFAEAYKAYCPACSYKAISGHRCIEIRK